jgi:hypothetical protein
MFDLEAAVKEWRWRCRHLAEVKPGAVEELESHLRDGVEQLGRDAGLSPEEAFHVAAQRIGEPASLFREYVKANLWSLRGRIYSSIAASLVGWVAVTLFLQLGLHLGLLLAAQHGLPPISLAVGGLLSCSAISGGAFLNLRALIRSRPLLVLLGVTLSLGAVVVLRSMVWSDSSPWSDPTQHWGIYRATRTWAPAFSTAGIMFTCWLQLAAIARLYAWEKASWSL